jgi:hypothetical protein
MLTELRSLSTHPTHSDSPAGSSSSHQSRLLGGVEIALALAGLGVGSNAAGQEPVEADEPLSTAMQPSAVPDGSSSDALPASRDGNPQNHRRLLRRRQLQVLDGDAESDNRALTAKRDH